MGGLNAYTNPRNSIAATLVSKNFAVVTAGISELGKRYWGRHFWAVGFWVWSTDNITDEMIQEYPEHHREKPKFSDGELDNGIELKNFILYLFINLWILNP